MKNEKNEQEKHNVRESDALSFLAFMSQAAKLENFSISDWDDPFIRWQVINEALQAGRLRIESDPEEEKNFLLVLVEEENFLPEAMKQEEKAS